MSWINYNDNDTIRKRFENTFVTAMIKYEDLLKIMHFNQIPNNSTMDVYINMNYVIGRLHYIDQYNIDCYRSGRHESNLNLEQFCLSGIFNIISHYRRFFVYSNIYPRIHLYFNKLPKHMRASSENDVALKSFYKKVIPVAMKVSQYLKDTYIYLIDNEIDSSVIPYIINNEIYHSPSTSKLIISDDHLDDIYYLSNNTIRIKYRLKNGKRAIASTLEQVLVEDYQVDIEDASLLKNNLFFTTLIGCSNKLSKTRHIQNVTGYGVKRLIRDIKKGIKAGIITSSTKSQLMLSEIFPDNIKNDMIKLIKKCDLTTNIMKASEKDINNIKRQTINLFDNEGLKELSSTVFIDYPIALDDLTRVPRFMFCQY